MLRASDPRYAGPWRTPRLGQSGQTSKSESDLLELYLSWTSTTRIRSPAGQSVLSNRWSVPSSLLQRYSPPPTTRNSQTAIARPLTIVITDTAARLSALTSFVMALVRAQHWISHVSHARVRFSLKNESRCVEGLSFGTSFAKRLKMSDT
jgi:hypothetical protein